MYFRSKDGVDINTFVTRKQFCLPSGIAAGPTSLLVLVALLIASCTAGKAALSAERPNVILIMTDDQGYGDLGATRNRLLQTPNIDGFARQSASMANFYVSPVCSPTRASLMTGRYNYRTRVIDTFVGRSMMDPEEVTIAELLRDAGYATGIFGKWHLGDNYPLRPTEQGFEEALIHRGGGLAQPSDPPENEGRYTDPVLFHNGTQVPTHGYCTDVFFGAAIDWIETCQKDHRTFFAYITPNAPHAPFDDVPKSLYEKYKQLDLKPWITAKNLSPKELQQETDKLARIYAMIANIDDNVGLLLRKLDELHLANDTIVIFMVDNGPNSDRYVAGLRGKKTDVYDGGIRSPFFIRWPGVLKPGHASYQIAAHIDILPTLLAACGVDPPSDLRLDGKNLMPLLQGTDEGWPDRTLFTQTHRGDAPVLYHHFAARNQRWKLVHPSGFRFENFDGEPKFELYDMNSDPSESRNVINEHSEEAAQLKRAYEEWFHDVSHTRPDNYAPARIAIGTSHENPVVLTRQDWRKHSGKTWAPNSNGYWELHVAQTGNYNVLLRFPATQHAGSAELQIDEKTISIDLPAGSTECVFDAVPFPKGDTRLMATLKLKKGSSGPYQVEVSQQ